MIYVDQIPENRIDVLTSEDPFGELDRIRNFLGALEAAGLVPRNGNLVSALPASGGAPPVLYMRWKPKGVIGRKPYPKPSNDPPGIDVGLTGDGASAQTSPPASKAPLQGRDRLGAELCKTERRSR